MNKLINISNQEGTLVVSSREVADNFGKRHSDVVVAIENKINNLTSEKSAVENEHIKIHELFIEEEYEHNGNTYKQYLLTRDGFSFMVMGFTGAKADQWKLKYIDQFNKMEKAIQGVYHISETSLTNNIMKEIETKLFHKIDDRLEVYEENYRPTHANKIKINNYIKDSLGAEREPDEADLVKQRVLLMLDAETWQDVPYKNLTGNMRLIDESIQAVKGFRTRRQLDLFESYL